MEHLEGRQSILAALGARRRRFDLILLRHGMHEDRIRDVLDAAQAASVPVRRVDQKELDQIAHGATHGGIVAICSSKPRATAAEIMQMVEQTPSALLLLLEGIEDARNLGFVLRTAEATGCNAVLIKKHLWDLDPVEIARPSSGAYERLLLTQIDDAKLLKSLQAKGVRLLGCIAGARQTIHQADLKDPVILAVGGEKRGLSGAVRDICDQLVSIPTVSDATSLSLSHAAAIVLAEAFRQRASL